MIIESTENSFGTLFGYENEAFLLFALQRTQQNLLTMVELKAIHWEWHLGKHLAAKKAVQRLATGNACMLISNTQ